MLHSLSLPQYRAPSSPHEQPLRPWDGVATQWLQLGDHEPLIQSLSESSALKAHDDTGCH